MRQKTTRTAATKGRKSAAQQAAETMKTEKRHEPPSTLSDRAKEIWASVVNTLPTAHFFPSDLQLLAEFCETAAIVERMRERWNGEPTTIKANGDEVVNPVLTALNRNQNMMQTLAGKLRICPSARISASSAGHEKTKKPSRRAHLL